MTRQMAGLKKNGNRPKYNEPSCRILENRLSDEIEGLSD